MVRRLILSIAIQDASSTWCELQHRLNLQHPWSVEGFMVRSLELELIRKLTLHFLPLSSGQLPNPNTAVNIYSFADAASPEGDTSSRH